MKKILLNEAEKKAIILEREKAIVANFAKTFNTIKRIDENEVAGIETKELEKKAFDFANSPEMGQLVDKILANAKPEDLEQIKRAVGSVSEGMMSENDFSSFLNIAHKAQSALNEDNSVGSLQNSVGKALSTFGVVNIMSMGALPSLVGMAVDYFGGTNFLQTFTDAVGSGGAAAGLSVIGGLIGGGLLWRLGKAISGEKVTGNTPLFEMGMNDGDENGIDPHGADSRGVEYGINPYQEQPEMETENTYKVEVIGKEAEKDGGYKHRWVYEITANNEEEAEAKAQERFNENFRLSDIYLFSVKVISDPTEDDKVQPIGVRF